MKHFLSLFLFAFVLGACKPTTKAGACDPLSQKKIRGTQYISNEILNEEGNWDYAQWTKHYLQLQRHAPVTKCIPIENALTLEERIQEQNQIVDLKR